MAGGPFPWSASRVRQMNCTPAEFRRALVQAFGAAVSEDKSGLLLTTDGAVLHFALSLDAPFQVGLLKIPLLRVEITARQGDDIAVRRLLEQVDRATLRGGG